MTKLELYRDWLQHCPPSPGSIVDGCRGHFDGAGYFVCATCAGRLSARSCSLHGPAREIQTVWSDPAQGDLACDVCGTVDRAPSEGSAL